MFKAWSPLAGGFNSIKLSLEKGGKVWFKLHYAGCCPYSIKVCDAVQTCINYRMVRFI